MKHKILFSLMLLLAGCSANIATPPTHNTIVVPVVEEPKAAVSNGPTHIALLLPLEGKLDATAQAFRDGFFDAYYADRIPASKRPKLTVIDTKNDAHIVASYQKAVNKGADFIVGPLTKPGVTTLNASDAINVPTLALNKIVPANKHPEKLYFFSLAPEDEAAQVAKQARQHGAATALIIAEKSDWGECTAEAFAKNWQHAGGKVVSITYYQEDEKFDAFTKKALQIKVTQEDNDGQTKAYTRRKDVDMVFLASSAEDARQIRPFISFYYTDELPVYATASIYAESPNATLDRDANGIIFCDMPWIIDPKSMSSSLRNGLDEMWTNSSIDLSRLYAMGADAYELTKQISKSKSPVNFSHRGATGYLSVSGNQVVQRELLCARLQGGKPRVLR